MQIEEREAGKGQVIGLFLSNSLFHGLKELGGVVLEKVELHHDGDTE